MSWCACEVYADRKLVGWLRWNRTADVLAQQLVTDPGRVKDAASIVRGDCGRPPVDVVVYNSFDRWWTDGKACLTCGSYLGSPFPLGAYETGEPRTAHDGCPDFLAVEVLR